ncbi:sugar ABC transporter substrate-binding protein [Inconstantimicrobium mannanitabidum]|uniref:D-xylose ABC transporter substrate-binding protein n=1 Tax=Inconstantimicrobium mannanitabidum TaxID=1604901 RepID=A0ACB5R9T4_9CLOT|nr:substrate-binding domain-containing protein [Clostridium sp. TW13]GKX65795.1 D-xylose ABC transporter substrate-binding protein [Clostridium sp. TW13]
MYLSIPDSFFMPVHYVDIDILELIVHSRHLKKDYFNNLNRQGGLVIGVSLPNQREERWIRDRQAMEAYAKEKNITIKFESADFDVNKQVQQVENLISQGVNVLIILPLDPVTGIELVEKAHKAGIKVVDYDLLLKNSDIDAFVAFNGLRVGELQGQYLVSKVPRGNYVIMSGDPDVNFKEGAMEFIQPLVFVGNIKIVEDAVIKGWVPSIAYDVVKAALAKNNNKIDAILAPNDATAGAAIQALQEQGLAGKVAVTGQDADIEAVRRIIEGTQSMTVFKDTRELAKAAIDVAVKLADNETLVTDTTTNNGKRNVPTILIQPMLVDKSNIDKVLIDSGYLKKEDVYRGY